MYIDNLDDLVNKYYNAYHRTIKMKPIDVKEKIYISIDKEVNYKDPKFKVSHQKYQNTETFFAKGYTPNSSEGILVTKKVKNTIPSTYIINDLNDEEIVGTIYEKQLQKTYKGEFRIEKVITKKEISYILSGKDMIVHSIVGSIKKI